MSNLAVPREPEGCNKARPNIVRWNSSCDPRNSPCCARVERRTTCRWTALFVKADADGSRPTNQKRKCRTTFAMSSPKTIKDIHGERSTPGRILIVSPALHCVAMTALVYLRSSFGFTMFRPRTIFFAVSFALIVLDYIAWNEADIWREYHTLCIFAAGERLFYWLHFGVTVGRELHRKAERDD